MRSQRARSLLRAAAAPLPRAVAGAARLVVILALALSSVVVIGAVAAPAAAAATPCDPPVVNEIVCENSRPGVGDWQVGFRDDTIEGFPTDVSTTPGGRVDFKIRTDAAAYRVDIFRLGWYGGLGARQVATVNRTTPQTQPACLFEPVTAFHDCGNWAVSLSWQVPADAVSGIYYARLHRPDTGVENEIAFVVRDDGGASKILFQTSDSTWVAYNRHGGNSLYFGNGPGQGGSAYKASYNRPLSGEGEENFIFNAEYPMLRFLEANGYDVSYTTDADTARRGQLITTHDVFMAVGHDEYWSNEQRANVEAARDAGVHLAFLTGNEIFWKTRWEPSTDASATEWRTVVTYKETKASAKIDPSPQWTGTWRDLRFGPSVSDAARPENALLGNIFTVNGRREDSLAVPSAYGRMRLWRHTPLATMAAGATHTFEPGTLGYEWNSVEDNGFQPPGVAQLSRTTVDMQGSFVLQNYGDLYTSGTKTHALTLYRHASGALVFGAGTVQWAWGVDDEHAFRTTTPTSDVRIKQATVNVLADMGVAPSTLQPGLTAATASTDAAAPVVTVTDAPPATVGTAYTFSGTVTDAGGQVAGVEVSVDGTTWHPAAWQAGQTAWSYTFIPPSSGTASLRVRAVDDSANLGAPVTATPGVAPRTCPCGIWTDATTPAVPDTADGSALELGVKFRSSADGFVRGVRFYKGAGNTGTHTGSLWSSAGQQLATGTFAAETATGWQTLTFPVPVAVTANTTYVVSYFAPNGHYSSDAEYFTRKAAVLEPLTAPQSGGDGPNGLFKTGGPGFPTQSFQDTNYWVDVVWAPDPGPDTRAPGLAGTAPIDGAGTVGLAEPITATFDEAIAPASVQFSVSATGAVAGTASVSPDGRTVRFTPAAPLAAATAHTATLTATDVAGNPLAAPVTFSFTTGSPRPAACPCTVWDDFARPSNPAAQDGFPIEVGTKVRFDGRGEVLGVRFYKGPGNTGTHTGSLWTASGTRLATGTFTQETATGWQTLTFTDPVAVSPNTTYVVSSFAPRGHYAVDADYFSASGADFGGLHALRDGADGGNGLYRYSNLGEFPTGSFRGSNYWVDVIYRSGLNGDTTPPTLTARTPAPGATGVPLATTLTATFSEPVDPDSAQIWLTDPGGARLAGSVTLSADQRTVTWTPAAALAPATAYPASVRIADVNGVAMAAAETWSFTTVAEQTCPCSLFSAATTPTVTNADDGGGAYELGVRFTPSTNGTVTAVRFYKGVANTGTHTGSLWSPSGQQLATGTFTGETAGGWQTLTFASPAVVQAGQTYTASYTTTVGRYAVDSGYFQRTAVSSPPLSAQAPNGFFRGGSGFPTSTFGGGNYWVDVVFVTGTDQTPPTVTSRSPAPDATDAALAGPITTTFDEPVELEGAQVGLRDPGGTALVGTASLSADRLTLTWTPAAPLAPGTRYTASVRVVDTAGTPMPAAVTWSFTTAAGAACPCSLFSAATVPTVPAADDGGSYELGVRVVPSAAGTISGVRFYKGPGNDGTHTGSLWSATGELLAAGTFTGETATGWQTLTFATPVPVTAGSTYTASYTTATGRYAVDGGYFERTAVTAPPLSAPAVGGGDVNGVYQVGPGFPTLSYQGGNYWVDVVYNVS